MPDMEVRLKKLLREKRVLRKKLRRMEAEGANAEVLAALRARVADTSSVIRELKATEAKNAFALFDSDGDRLINKAEFATVFTLLAGHALDPAELDATFARVNKDDNAHIDLREFVAWWVLHGSDEGIKRALRLHLERHNSAHIARPAHAPPSAKALLPSKSPARKQSRGKKKRRVRKVKRRQPDGPSSSSSASSASALADASAVAAAGSKAKPKVTKDKILAAITKRRLEMQTLLRALRKANPEASEVLELSASMEGLMQTLKSVALASGLTLSSSMSSSSSVSSSFSASVPASVVSDYEPEDGASESGLLARRGLQTMSEARSAEKVVMMEMVTPVSPATHAQLGLGSGAYTPAQAAPGSPASPGPARGCQPAAWLRRARVKFGRHG